MSTKVSVKRTVTKTKPTVREIDSVEKKDDWEYRDRMYVIAKGSPVSYQLRTQHSHEQDLYPNSVEISHNMLDKHGPLNVHKKK